METRATFSIIDHRAPVYRQALALHQGKGDFGDHQRTAQPFAPCGESTAALAERTAQFAAGGVKREQQSEKDSREQSKRERQQWAMVSSGTRTFISCTLSCARAIAPIPANSRCIRKH